MKQSLIVALLLLTSLVLIGAGGAKRNLLKNGGFERFVGNEPDGWTTTNIPKTVTVVSPSPRAHGGTTAVKCEVRTFGGSKIAGMIRQKDISISAPTLVMNGYYVLSSVGKDIGYIALDFQNEDGSTIGTFDHELSGTKADFTRFALTINVPPTAVRVELKCTLLPGPGGGTVHEGSTLLLDDLELLEVSPEQKPVP